MIFLYFVQLWSTVISQMLPGNYRIDGQIENEVIGSPDVQCSEEAITFSIRTIAPFRGSIYVKGHYGMDVCRQEFYANDFNGATFVVRIGDCGMRRIRQLQPHGMNYVLTFVTNFHPHFMTKIDRAYNVRCFYAYVDKTVNTDMEPPNCPLVTRGEFEPNSVIDSSVNPTQVMATFEGTLRSGIGNAILDGTLHQPMYTGEFETMNPWRKEQDGMADDDNKTETKTHTKTVITEEKNFKARQTTLKMLTTETTPEETTSYRIPPTEVNLFHWTIPVIPDISNDRPLEIFVKSTSPAPNTQALYERTGRRLADQIIDVMTEELTLRPVDDPPSSTAAESLPVPSSPQLTCLNQTAMFTLFGAFAITALFSTVFITYLFRDVCRSWTRSSKHIEHLTVESLHSECSSEAVSDSIDRRGDLPIYTRRLGDPTYVVTTRSYRCV
ncbi:hypothetical protein Angca_009544 [Angiostrongylus cantonensis]|nr:hypothetical protein Angca_009544 [Angiostrongylus cantonensis]